LVLRDQTPEPAEEQRGDRQDERTERISSRERNQQRCETNRVDVTWEWGGTATGNSGLSPCLLETKCIDVPIAVPRVRDERGTVGRGAVRDLAEGKSKREIAPCHKSLNEEEREMGERERGREREKEREKERKRERGRERESQRTR
jgi:hypothetical protein